MSAVDCCLPSFHPFKPNNLGYFPPLEDCMERPSPIDSSASTISTSPGAITPLFGLTLTVDPGLLEKSPKTLSLPTDLGKRKRYMSPSMPNQQDYESRRRRTEGHPFEYRSSGSFDSAFASRVQYTAHYDTSTQLRQHSYPTYHPHSRTGSTNTNSPSYSRDSSLQVPEVSSAPWLTSPVTSMASLETARMASKSPRIPEWSQPQDQHVQAHPHTTFSPAYSPLNSFAPHDAPQPASYSYPPISYTSTSPEAGRRTQPVPSRDKSKSISSTSDQALPAVVAQITAHQRLQHQQAAQHPNRSTEEHSLPLRSTQQTNSPEQELTPGAQREKLTCWEHGCNGRVFSTFSNLLRHQREKAGTASKSSCPKCGAEFTRTTARNSHLVHAKCRPGERKDSKVG